MSHSVPTEKTNTPSSSALWAVLIFVGLIICAINFVKAESADEGHGEHGAGVEHVEGGGAASHATTEEHAAVTPAATEHTTTETAADTAHHEAQPAGEEVHH